MAKASVAISIVFLATILIFKLPGVSSHIEIAVSENTFVAEHFKYQLLLLSLAVVVLALVYIQSSENFFRFVSLGNISAPASSAPIFGIKKNESWLGVGINLSFIITLVTTIFVYLQAKGGGISWGTITPYLGWVILFALVNSFSEEVIFRLGLVIPLYEVMSAGKIMLISAIIFGVAHYAGMPNGIVGMLMAGVLGWVLTKSLIETQGIFWAWFIHFVQDIVIFIGFLFIKARENLLQEVA